ncbi:MAG: sterol desaturase family protein [Candidatus Binatia bacterium]|nr:sterol desaturase family protein [Candidatus Binatia bacterium]
MRENISRLVARTAFPLAITVGIGSGIFFMNRGAEPDLVAGLIILASYAFIGVLERLVPLHPEWRHDTGDLKADIALGLTNAVVNGIAQPLFIVVAISVATWLSATYGAQVWPDQWPLLVQLVPALLLGELVEYTAHRTMHEVPWLWRFHAPHHSATRLYWFNALRFHPIDILAVGPGKLVPLVVLGADGPVIALVGLFSAIHGVYQHANIPCRIGPLNWVFSMAELHRWHHSPSVEEANHNYGGNLIFWDIVFGTRWLPADREPPTDIGIADLPNFPKGYASIMASPFRWAKVVHEAAPAASRSAASNE